ncbi:T9SS type A sorting domain-containing protein [Rubricoccus marinus]|uniref:Secretion system C-terminal sorting domain-containing protein n=1 Tax=Rubricoccus marinus TaxID=716817 RepID=A0A259U166_9BACT|nr:T9SS type A sorting domain-containing protein [Rubricoccus marinus]OZC03732.1 hypothetical protein BSZ36_12515 [Rubricoccus marinus]
MICAPALVREPGRFACAPEASGASIGVSPNPTSGATTVRLQLPSRQTDVRVSIFDARGREVTTLASDARESGAHVLAIDTSAWAAGVYIVRAEVGGVVASARFVVAQ